ncbi:MAG TPA: hypothetical protein VMY42_27505 [Thermoguttaceae bacterium]|nr:hypothetical protein [Thermoguttaceae bacterium]
MGDGILDKMAETIGISGRELMIYAVVVLAVLLALLVVWKVITGRKHHRPERGPDLTIDVQSLGTQGLPPGAPVLEFYNVPVRLAAVVLAPAGRGSVLPPPSQLTELIDQLVPGLAEVVKVHKPLIRRWPPQLSAEGFARTVFANVKLPGDHGKGTPWCSVAGRVGFPQGSLMLGLILRAASPNNFGESMIAKEHEWLGVLRARSG